MDHKSLFVKPGSFSKGTLQNQSEEKNNPFNTVKTNISSSEQISSVTTKLEDVKKAIHTNIEIVLKRGEDLEDLEDKTENLSDTAKIFSNQGRRLKNTMRWRKIKMILFLICIMLIVIGIIIGIVYGFVTKTN